MDRREFLKILPGLGVALALPYHAIALAPEAEIQKAWEAVEADPPTFDVGGYRRTLTIPDFQGPVTRRDCMPDFWLQDIPSADYLIPLAEDDCRIEAVLAQAYLDSERMGGEVWDVPGQEWKIWLRADRDHVSCAASRIEDWLDETDLHEADWDQAEANGETARSAAMRFWEREDELCRLFSVDIVEGECPGSSYYAAELTISVDDANEIARKNGIPFTFRAV